MAIFVSDADTPPRTADGRNWWNTAYGRWRLKAESEAMQRFPRFKLRLRDGQLSWRGLLTSTLERNRYLVRVVYPSTFPDDAPTVVIEAPELGDGVPHLLSGQRPCLYLPSGPQRGYDPARTTAATLVAWTALWIHAFETWVATGSWPGAED
jgi:hypothetical protein